MDGPNLAWNPKGSFPVLGFRVHLQAFIDFEKAGVFFLGQNGLIKRVAFLQQVSSAGTIQIAKWQPQQTQMRIRSAFPLILRLRVTYV